MEALKAKGLEIYAAYGNTATDIRAYAAAGIPKVSSKACPLEQIYAEMCEGPCDCTVGHQSGFLGAGNRCNHTQGIGI